MNASKEYLLNRGITGNTINILLDDRGVEFKPKWIRFAMRSIPWLEVTGRKYRFIEPTYIKEMNEACGKMWFFSLWRNILYMWWKYGDVEGNKKPHDIFLVEGSIDYCTALSATNQVVGLPTIVLLARLIKTIQELETNIVIYLLTDNDEAGNNEVEKIRKKVLLLENVFDCRSYFAPYKDINEFVMAGNKINIEEIKKHAKPMT